MAFWGPNGLFGGLGKVQKLFWGEYNATLCPPTDQLKLGLAQLSLSVCKYEYQKNRLDQTN